MQILSTKLSIPPLRSRLVARLRLIHEPNQGVDCGFVLISAPAGYGKSTLLSAWLDQVDFASCWLSLDQGKLRETFPACHEAMRLAQSSSAPYRTFVQANDLQAGILSALKDADASLPATLETASEER